MYTFTHAQEFALKETDSGVAPACSAAVLIFDRCDSNAIYRGKAKTLNGIAFCLVGVLRHHANAHCAKHERKENFFHKCYAFCYFFICVALGLPPIGIGT